MGKHQQMHYKSNLKLICHCVEKYYKHIIKVDGQLGGERRKTSEKDCHCLCLCHYLGQLKQLNVVRGGGRKGREKEEDIQE